MIQRIQTLLLLGVVVLGVFLLFQPVLQFNTTEDEAQQHLYELSALSLTDITDYQGAEDSSVPTMQGLWGLTLTTLLIPLLAFVAIFLFRHRIFQARFNIFLAVLCLGYYGILFMYAWFGRVNLLCEWHLCFGACIPLVCFVLTLSAIRHILKDEALVRSADRLR